MSAPEITRASVGLRSERGPLLLAVMLSIGLVAIDATILATAVPAVVDDLGGFTSFPWLFSIYLLAQAVSVPIYGKVADLYGRKPVMLLGIGLFVVGSLLCGIAWSMPALIVFRLIQGLGAGAVQPMGMTIVGDIYSLAERAKVQGYIASVWAIASVVGPTLGGVFADYLSWRWIFFVNLPLGIAAGWVLWRRFDENVEPPQARHRLRGRRAAGSGRLAAAARPARGWGALGVGFGRQRRDPGAVGSAARDLRRGRGTHARAGAPVVDLPAPRAERGELGSLRRRGADAGADVVRALCMRRPCSATAPSWPVWRWRR